MPVQSALGARLTVRNVRANGAAIDTKGPDPTTLVLERPLTAAERVTVSMSWTLQLPRRPTDRLAATSFGVRLTSFFPLLAWSGRDWALDPPAPQMETWTSPTSDFDVRIKTAKGMRVFATGATVGKGHWRATAVRDFVVDAGRHFAVGRRVVHVACARGDHGCRGIRSRLPGHVPRYGKQGARCVFEAYRVATPRDFLDAFTPLLPETERVLSGFGVRF
jgi:hypothetical protein